MAEEPEENSPPQPILIHGGTPTLETEASPVPEPSPAAEEESAKVETAPNQFSHGVSDETIQAYEIVLRNKPNTNTIGVLTIIFLFVIPAVMLYSTGFDILFEDEATFCCGSIILGLVLGLILSVTEAEWGQKRKRAEKRVMTEAGIGYPPVPSWPSLAAATCLVLAFFLSDFDEEFCFFGGILGMFGLIFLGLSVQMRTSAQKAVEKQLKLIIKK